MIIEIPENNSIIRWKYMDEWKCAEISDLIVAYEKQEDKTAKLKLCTSEKQSLQGR